MTHNEKALVDLKALIEQFCKSERFGEIRIDIRNHEIKGIKQNRTRYIKLPLEKRTN